jgi:hypothetical protein
VTVRIGAWRRIMFARSLTLSDSPNGQRTEYHDSDSFSAPRILGTTYGRGHEITHREALSRA